MGHLKRKRSYSNHPFQVRTFSFKEGRSFCFFFFPRLNWPLGHPFFRFLSVRKITDKERISDLITDGSASEYGILVDEKTARWPEKPMVIFGSLIIGGNSVIYNHPNWQYIPLIYSLLGGEKATYHLLGVTRNNPLIFHRLCYGSSPQWRSQLRWVFFKFASSGWSFQQMDFCLLSTYFFIYPKDPYPSLE